MLASQAMAKPNYLYELLGALTEAERVTVDSLELKGKEQALLDFYLSRLGQKAPAKDEISSVLLMSGAHIDKTSSIVLKKSYELLVPAGGTDLWIFLRQKRLIRHLYHELNLEERELLRAKDTEALASFYFDAFEALHTMNFQDYDPEEGKRYMNRYFELRPNTSATERLMVEGRLIRQLIINAQANGKIDDSLVAIESDLKRLEDLIDDSVAAASLCQFYLAVAHFYKVVSVDTQKQRHYLQIVLDIMERDHEEFTTEDRELMKCKVADTYYQESEFETAYSIYKQIIPFQLEVFKSQFFFTSTYLQLAILCNDDKNVEQIVAQFYQLYLDQGADGSQAATSASLCLAKKFLLAFQPEKAYPYITLGFASNDKNILASFEIELRKLETIYFIEKNDIGFAEELIDKHIKYMQSKKISVRTNMHGIFFKLLRAIIDERRSGKKLTAEQERQIAEQSSGFVAIYGRLLSKVRTTI
jgi:hypothetical protein